MTVATGIEIGPGGRSTADQGQVLARTPGKTPSAGWGSVLDASSSANAVPGAESFRSGWQSLLASLGADMEGLSGAEAETGETQETAEAALAESGEKASAKTSTLAGAATLPPLTIAEGQGSGLAAGSTALSLPGLRTGVPGWRSASELSRQSAANSAANAAAKTLASVQSASSLGSAHAANSAKSAKLETASNGTAATATADNLPLAMPVPVTENVTVKTAETHPQSSSTNLSAELRNGSSSDGVNSHSTASDGSGLAAGLTSAAGNRGGETAAAALPGKASLVAANDLSTSGNIEGEKTPSSGTVGAESGIPQHTAAQGLNQVQAQHGSNGVEAIAPPAASAELNLGSVSGNATASQSGQPSEIPIAVEKTGLTSGGRTSTQATQRLARSSGTFEPAQHAIHPVEGQSASLSTDAASLTRDPAGARGAMNVAAASAGGSSSSAVGSSAHETFSALDAEAAPGTPTWIHAGAQRAEAGFQDPVLGWVGVRADTGGGGVHASLVPGSTDAAEALGSHLAGLNAYLAEHHTSVDPVTVAAPENGSATGMDQSANQNMHQGAGQNTGSQASPQTSATAATGPELPAHATSSDATTPAIAPGGLHISVMA